MLHVTTNRYCVMNVIFAGINNSSFWNEKESLLKLLVIHVRQLYFVF